MSAWSSFRSITWGMVQRHQTRQMSLSCIQLSVFWAARNKQCLLAAGKHHTLISWRKESTWRSKTLMCCCYETHFGASWPTSDMPPTMDFDGIVNCKTFSHGNTVCNYQLFYKLLHILIETYPKKVVQFFYCTVLIWLDITAITGCKLCNCQHIGKPVL